MNRALSIINDGVDLAPFHFHHQHWFKDVDGKSPMDLEWKGTNIPRHNHNRDFSHTITLLQKLRWLIKEIPSNLDNRTPISNIVYQKGAHWYSYTYDTERKKLDENLFADELTGAPIQHDIAARAAEHINSKIQSYIKAQARLDAQRLRTQRNEDAMRRYANSLLAQRQQTRIEVARRRELRERQAIQDFQKKLDALPPPASKIIDCDECPICMEPLGQTNIVVLRCGHKTCADCIFQHFQRSGGTSCPSCRQDFAVRLPGWTPPTPVF